MKIKDLINDASNRLCTAGIEEPRFEAELFMAETLKKSRIQILTQWYEETSEEQQLAFESMILRRTALEPAAYIIGHKEFMGLEFQVGPGILIPRPDTEILVESSIETIKKYKLHNSVEVGLGSGCISVSLAKYTDVNCYGTDISQTALETAQKNARLNGVNEKVFFFKGDLFTGLPDIKFDMIVSNPPYIRRLDMEELMPDVREYEPYTALCGGDDGLDFYRRISRDGFKLLKNRGFILYEIGYDEAAEVTDILEKNGFKDIEVINDLSGLNRVIRARKGDFDV